MRRIWTITLISFVVSLAAFAQDSPLFVGELKITVSNAPLFPLQASVWLVGMGFVEGAIHSYPKTYSDVDTSSGGIIQPITGGSYTFTKAGDIWLIEHVEDRAPTPGYTWIGYGVYKITVGASFFYLDYLDSDYPYGLNPDITVTYDFNTPGNHLCVSAIDSISPADGAVVRIWSDLYGKRSAPNETNFQLPSTVPIGSKSCDSLFTTALINTYVTLPASKTLKIDRTAYPDESKLQPIGLNFSGASSRLLVYGNLNVNGSSSSHVTVDGQSYSRSGYIMAPIVMGSGGTATIRYTDFKNSAYGVTLYTNAGDATIENCTFENFVSDANARAIAVYGATGTITITSNTLTGPGQGTGIYLNSTGTKAFLSNT